MHARELIELSAQIAHQASDYLASPPVPDRYLARYWSASRCRVDRWAMELRAYADVMENPRREVVARQWNRVRPVLTEILLSETLTRVWAGLATAHDHRLKVAQMEPVARAVHVAHLEARHRTLHLMVYGRGFAIQEAVMLNRLRRRVETWTDSLLAHIHLEHDVRSLAFCSQRCGQFALDLAEQRRTGLLEPARKVARLSLQAAFHTTTTTPVANPELNSEIAAAVLACFDDTLFDSVGLPRTGWLARIERVADETQGMIDQLFALEQFGAHARQGPPNRTSRLPGRDTPPSV